MSQLSNPTNLIKVFARREPAIEPMVAARRDVVVYLDEACTKLLARFCSGFGYMPTRATKRVTINCWPWALNWIPDLTKR